MIILHTWSISTVLLVIRKQVIYILFWRLFFIAYLSENHAFSQNFYNLFWKYSTLPNEILSKHLFLKLFKNPFGMLLSPMEAKRQSQNLFPIVKMAENVEVIHTI